MGEDLGMLEDGKESGKNILYQILKEKNLNGIKAVCDQQGRDFFFFKKVISYFPSRRYPGTAAMCVGAEGI